jgi:uncharacterized protein YndB with AHSA1/START domain
MSTLQIIALAVTGIVLLELIVLLVLPKTKTMRVERRIKAPANQLYALLTDLSQTPKWYPGGISAERTSERDGAARRQRLVVQAGSGSMAIDQQVTTWVNDRQYGWKELPAAGPLQEVRTVFTLTEHGPETDVEILGEWTARSMITKIYANFGHPKLTKQQFDRILDNLDKLSTGKW